MTSKFHFVSGSSKLLFFFKSELNLQAVFVHKRFDCKHAHALRLVSLVFACFSVFVVLGRYCAYFAAWQRNCRR